MKPLPSFVTKEQSAARQTDRPQPSSKRSVIASLGTVMLFLLIAPFLLSYGCLFLGGTTQLLIDRVKGTLYLDKAVVLPSLDNRLRFEADTNGAIRCVDTPTGRVTHQEQLSVIDYRGINAHWRNPREVTLYCLYRYPALATGRTFVYDCQTGKLRDEDAHTNH